jgi:TIR domain
MPISHDLLTRAAARSRIERSASLAEARAAGAKTAFLCHSHLDATLVQGLLTLLQETGWNVYVDWRDTAMPSPPDRETAKKIQDRIQRANYFLFLATQNSLVSRWCPWEIGFADGAKSTDSILIVPTQGASGTAHGSEYLGLYRRIDFSDKGSLGAWQPGQQTNGLLLKNF